MCYVLCAELKKKPETKDIPIILLTAVGEAVPSTSYSHADGKATGGRRLYSKAG